METRLPASLILFGFMESVYALSSMFIRSVPVLSSSHFSAFIHNRLSARVAAGCAALPGSGTVSQVGRILNVGDKRMDSR